jgi:hypothetical protein
MRGRMGGMPDISQDDHRRDRLRHFPKMLQRWYGGRARLWELTVSHQTLIIRVERPGVHGNLHVACIGPHHIQSPSSWEDSHIDVALTDCGEWIVREAQAGVEVVAESVELKENCKPVYTPPQ